MKIKSSVLAISAVNPEGFPKDGLPQIALAGRSNAGKSSLINALIGSKNLARSSRTPGKTRLINFYLINKSFYFTDLPGFGYARVGPDLRRVMESALQGYFESMKSLRGVMYLVDVNVPDSPIDHEAISWILKGKHPLLVLAPKSDRFTKNELKKGLNQISKNHGLPMPPIPVSSHKQSGLTELWEQIEILLKG